MRDGVGGRSGRDNNGNRVKVIEKMLARVFFTDKFDDLWGAWFLCCDVDEQSEDYERDCADALKSTIVWG